jgi:hypothetical protein
MTNQDRRTAAMGARAVEPMDAGRIRDEDRIGAADEKPAFHYADDSPDALVQSRRIGDAAEIAIKDAVAAVGHKRFSGRHARASTAAEHFERLARCLESEGHHFDRDRCVRSKPVHQFATIDQPESLSRAPWLRC